MNILRAKQEIIHTVRAYLAKDEEGNYRIPAVHQRPVLLMGPPGIGKTAIMEQVATECGIALVSYTITHHTRQSAIGLPYLTKREYGGREQTITEYTMSEIIASVYAKMEETGLREGILFLDEINCVSETLAPTMLQLLQRKSFGSHFVPEGWWRDHGGQVLLCITLTGLSPFTIAGYGFYMYILAIVTIVTIQFGLMRTKEEKAGIKLYDENNQPIAAYNK